MIDMKKMIEIGKQIEKFYAEDRYTDIDGVVWLGTAVDERWYVEGCEMDEDPKYWLTNRQMMKKMCNELSGDEQFSRDEAARREAQYEYAAKRTSVAHPDMEYIVGNYWADKEDRSRFVKDMAASKSRYTYTLVRRRKAGPVEEVA